jgi:RimJ/RimL family protein N-acetyltransferase
MTQTQPQVVATGDLVRLREKQLEDARHDYDWRRDPELATYDAARPISMSFRAYAETVSDEINHPSPYRRSFAIEDLATGRHIGNVMYYGYDRQKGEAELGITIGLRAYWSRGFGTDAVRAMLGHLFGTLRLNRVYLHTLTWNDRAQQAFQRAGFHKVREVHRAGYDFYLMEIDAGEFDASSGSAASDSSSH